MSLTLVHLPAKLQRTGGTDPAGVVEATVASHTGRYGRRTLAHIQWTIAQLAKLHPGARLVIIQGCYNTGVALSAGTHDGDGVLDVEIIGLTWLDAQWFLRQCGWAAWWRHTGSWAAQSEWHIHMVSLGCPGPVGEFIPGQVDDYYRHALGLKGQHNSGDDPTEHPADIDATYFDFVLWEQELEDTMQDADWQKLQGMLDAQRKGIVGDLLGAIVDGGKVTLQNAVGRVAKFLDRNGKPRA